MYYAYDLLKDKVIYKTEELPLMLKALNLKEEQGGFNFEKIYLYRYIVTKNKITKKRLTYEEKIKIVVSDFGLTKPDFARISKEEMRMLEEKIKTLKIPKIHWFRYLKTTHYSEEKIKHTPKKIKEMLETARVTKEALKKPRARDLQKIDLLLDEFEIEEKTWYRYLEGIIEWTKKK